MKEVQGLGSRAHSCQNFNWFDDQTGVMIGALLLTIDEPLVTVTQKQGTLPQMLTLLGETGGYWALVGAIFALVFVKKHPESDVAVIYEARTLVTDKLFPYLQGKGMEKESE